MKFLQNSKHWKSTKCLAFNVVKNFSQILCFQIRQISLVPYLAKFLSQNKMRMCMNVTSMSKNPHGMKQTEMTDIINI